MVTALPRIPVKVAPPTSQATVPVVTLFIGCRRVSRDGRGQHDEIPLSLFQTLLGRRPANVLETNPGVLSSGVGAKDSSIKKRPQQTGPTLPYAT